MKFVRYLSLISIFFLASCTAVFEPMPKGWNWSIFKPRPGTGMRGFPSADTEYGKGFKDGCTSAWDAVTRGMTSDLGSKFDYKRSLKGADYGNGWWDGFEQCTYIVDHDVV